MNILKNKLNQKRNNICKKNITTSIIILTVLTFVSISDAQNDTIFDKDQLALGVSSYNDDYNKNEIGIMAEAKVAEWEILYIGFGTIIPLNYPKRTRPMLSLSTSLKKLTNTENSFDPSIGISWIISPYGKHGAWGINLILLKF